MLEAWVNFALIVSVQFIVLLIHAGYEKRLSHIPSILGMGIASGIVLGLLQDIFLGKAFDLWSYMLGFGAISLTLTAVFVYGLFAAHVLLMQKAKFLHFLAWTMIVGVVYEIANYFFPVWEYHFLGTGVAMSPLLLLSILVIGYIGNALLVETIWHFLFGYKFRIATDTLHSLGIKK